jgi:hypothetical protein
MIYYGRKIIAVILCLFAGAVMAQIPEWRTYYEKSGYQETPRYDETIRYCRQLAAGSPWIEYTTFGVSPQGRALPLLIADDNGNFEPQAVRASGHVVLLIQACIHPGECDGKDAGLMFFRDIAIYKTLTGLLNNVTILFIPIFNVDGHERFGPYNRINQNGPKEMGWRTTAQNLNLNRDYLKADAPEMKDWLVLFQKWLPDFFVDIHVTDGADYQYVVTYGVETAGNMDATLTKWVKDYFVPLFQKQLDKSGYPAFPYVSFRKWYDPRSGLITRAASPRFSQGYTAVQNRVGILIENHMLKDYRTRVTGTYVALKTICEILNSQYKDILKMNLAADETAASTSFRQHPFTLDYKTTGDSVMVDFKGMDYEVVKSDLTGGDWFRYSKTPKMYKLPYFNVQEPVVTVTLPEGYIIPAEWTSVIDRLAEHGIIYQTLKAPVKLKVQTYKFSDPQWSSTSYEGRQMMKAKTDTVEEEEEFPAGSVVVDMNQRASRVIAHILEPSGPDSYVYWGFFNTIFEQKEYAETYVMEAMAHRMVEKDPALKAEFEQKKDADPDFAKSQWAMLNWFYSKTPYWDKKLDVYPVGRIMSRSVLDKIIK